MEKSLKAKSGTALAKSFAGIKPTKNDFFDIVGSDSAAHVLFQVPLFIEDFQLLLGKCVEVGVARHEKNKNASRKSTRKCSVSYLPWSAGP